MYTLKEVCEMLDLSVHTVRYYTDEGLIPHMKRDKNNRRIFDDQSLDWLRGTKYLRELGMSIESIKQYHILCQQDGEDAIKQRYEIVLEQVENAKKELEQAQKRVEFLTKKADHEKLILDHVIEDSKNPGKKHYD